jgi:hypothetical protein
MRKSNDDALLATLAVGWVTNLMPDNQDTKNLILV